MPNSVRRTDDVCVCDDVIHVVGQSSIHGLSHGAVGVDSVQLEAFILTVSIVCTDQCEGTEIRKKKGYFQLHMSSLFIHVVFGFYACKEI